MRLRWLALVSFAALLLAVRCSEPPQREMDLAQGAIDAARAAGADRYAADAYKQAIDSLTRSREAVDQSDYRLALNYALEAHEQAQQAAKIAAAERAARRSEAEAAVVTVEAALNELRARLNAPADAPLPRAGLASARNAVRKAEDALQEARAAIEREEYEPARDALSGIADLLRANAASLDATLKARPPRRRR